MSWAPVRVCACLGYTASAEVAGEPAGQPTGPAVSRHAHQPGFCLPRCLAGHPLPTAPHRSHSPPPHPHFLSFNGDHYVDDDGDIVFYKRDESLPRLVI